MIHSTMRAAVYQPPVSMEEPVFLSTVSFTENQANFSCMFPATHYCVKEQFSISLLKCNYNLQRSFADEVFCVGSDGGTFHHVTIHTWDSSGFTE